MSHVYEGNSYDEYPLQERYNSKINERNKTKATFKSLITSKLPDNYQILNILSNSEN